VPQFVGRSLGVSEWVTVGQDRIDQFATCTGDRQWIHVDVERAKRESPFGAPIAHGYLTLALVGALVTELGVIPPDGRYGTKLWLGQSSLYHTSEVRSPRSPADEPDLCRTAEQSAHAAQAAMHVGNRGRG
jgi:hypothetical protein